MLGAMTKGNEILLRELIEAGNVQRLKEMRAGFLHDLPIELMHIEDREVCEAIDAYMVLVEKNLAPSLASLGVGAAEA